MNKILYSKINKYQINVRIRIFISVLLIFLIGSIYIVFHYPIKTSTVHATVVHYIGLDEDGLSMTFRAKLDSGKIIFAHSSNELFVIEGEPVFLLETQNFNGRMGYELLSTGH